MRTNLLSKSDTSSLTERIASQWKWNDMPRAKNARVYHLDGAQLVEISDMRVLDIDGVFLPFLGDTKTLAKFPSVTVDMGAVKFMCNGANVMRPGIKENTEFGVDQIVCVIEESQHKFLAVGRAIVKSDQVNDMKHGEVLKNIHYISDKYWESVKEIDVKTIR